MELALDWGPKSDKQHQRQHLFFSPWSGRRPSALPPTFLSMWETQSSCFISEFLCSAVTKTTSCTFPALEWITEQKGILNSSNLPQQKISRQTDGRRVRAPWKHRCCVFSQWKNQQVLLWTSFLSGEETEDWDIKIKKMKGGERAGGWKEGENVTEREREEKDADVKKQNTLVWVGACCPSLRPEISSSPRVTTCYYGGAL